jgi:16S rRNA (cytosine1402-N4)-methyltransferase
MSTAHIPILVAPIIEALIKPLESMQDQPGWFVDCTLGGGGHCSALLEALKARSYLGKIRVIAVDQDGQALERARLRFSEELKQGYLELVHSRFGHLASHLRIRRGIDALASPLGGDAIVGPIVGLMADLGFSSDQVEQADRGLSFMKEGPLDMRLDSSLGKSCVEILSEVAEGELERWLREWGDERFSRQIAGSIVYHRQKGCLPRTTKALSDLVVRAIPFSARHGRIHAATRTFQALRMAVNEEVAELGQLLDEVIPQVCSGGRIAILSFHSVEDRQVKWKFRNKELYSILTKKPIQASAEEMSLNPRSRSAKLRIVEKV